MRRVLSVLLFILGGWIAMTELMAAFLDAEPGSFADNAAIIGIFGALAGVFLLLGTWASPGRRWRELGLTILIAAGWGTLCGLMVVMIMNDPTARPLFPQDMPHIDTVPALGILNLIAVAALGWWLYRRRAVD